MTQDERLDFLLGRFQAESDDYRDLDTGGTRERRWQVLRSLMNVRPPWDMDEETLAVQDAYLREAAREKGIVGPEGIPTVRERYGDAVPCADRISLWQGDIARLAVDAVVNAANSQMLGCFIPCHGCIDNCIHTWAGVRLRAECARQMGVLRARYGPGYEQPTAVPMLTDGYDLPAKKVVHIVGPIVQGRVTAGQQRELAACYERTLDLCRGQDLRSVAFCCISTGVFRFPQDQAARIAVETVSGWLSRHEGEMDRVIFDVFSDEDRILYERVLGTGV